MAYTVIGRIRPRPMGAWNAETEYETLDVAMQPDGAGAFMAIQNVPAGIELSNSGYWLPVVDINAAVDAAKAATALAEQAAAEVKGDVEQLKGDLDDFESNFIITGNFTSDYVAEYQDKAVNDYNGKIYWLDKSGYVSRLYKVNPNTTYTCTFSRYTHFIGDDKETIVDDGLMIDNKTFTTNANTYYVAICYAVSDYPNWHISEGTVLKKNKSIRVNNLIADFDIVVDKNGNGDYTTLTEAVANALSGDIIFVRSGIYDNEEVEAYGKEITIIGENPNTTIIENGLDLYARPPIEMSVGLVKNITFWSYGEDGGDGRHAYAMHNDDDSLQDKTFTAENCIFRSRSGYSALGLGLRKGCKVTFKDCHFITDSGVPIFINEATNQQTHGAQQLSIINCIFEACSAQRSMILRGMKVEGNEVYCTFIDNVFSSTDTTLTVRADYTSDEYIGTSTTMGNFGMINWFITENSFGNNIDIFNKARSGTVDIINN